MPIYEYQCTECGYIFEDITLNMKDGKITTTCPKCKKDNKKSIAMKLASNFSFTVNGFNSNNGYAGNMR